MAGVGQCRFLITILALQVHGDLLHHAPWLVVQTLARGPIFGAHFIDRDQKRVWIVTKRHVTDKIRQKVVETFRISGDDKSRKRRSIFGYFTFWYIGILFFLWLFPLMLMLGRRGGQISKIELWFVANIIEGYLEPFCFGGGLFIVAAIGLIVDFVFVGRDGKRGRRRRRQLKEK